MQIVKLFINMIYLIDSILKTTTYGLLYQKSLRPDVKQMRHSEKLDLRGFEDVKQPKERFIHDSASGEASFAPLQLFSRR